MNNRVSKGKRRADKLFKFEMTFSLPKKFAKLVTREQRWFVFVSKLPGLGVFFLL